MPKVSRILKILRSFTPKFYWHWLHLALLLADAGYGGHLLSTIGLLEARRTGTSGLQTQTVLGGGHERVPYSRYASASLPLVPIRPLMKGTDG